jgi:hypothetical protein
MLRAAFLSTLIALAVTGGGHAETYVQDFEEGLTEDGFVAALVTEPGDDWQGSVEDGAYVLVNRSERGAVRYFDFNRVDAEGTSRPQTEASVTVSGDFETDLAAAGLLARYDPQSGTYYAFVRTAEGVALYKRGPDGFTRPMNLVGPIRGDEPARLGIRLSPRGTELIVNGRTLGAMSSGDIQGNRFGIVAFDRGTFRFDDFTVTTE